MAQVDIYTFFPRLLPFNASLVSAGGPSLNPTPILACGDCMVHREQSVV